MRYLADDQRHLVCEPYSRAGLIAMADRLDIPRHWLHPGRLAHVDIPVTYISRVLSDPRVEVVSPREILAVIKRAATSEPRSS